MVEGDPLADAGERAGGLQRLYGGGALGRLVDDLLAELVLLEGGLLLRIEIDDGEHLEGDASRHAGMLGPAKLEFHRRAPLLL